MKEKYITIRLRVPERVANVLDSLTRHTCRRRSQEALFLLKEKLKEYGL